MSRAAWVAAAVLVVVITYGVVATIVWTRDGAPSLAERHRRQFCSDFGNVVAKHRHEVEAQFHWDENRYKRYITYLSREERIIVEALRFCVPTFRIGEQTSDWLAVRGSDALMKQAALDEYLVALDIVELMFRRQKAQR